MASSTTTSRQKSGTRRARGTGSSKASGKASKKASRKTKSGKPSNEKSASGSDTKKSRAGNGSGRGATGGRYDVPHDVDRPHVPLGIAWFVLIVATLVVGTVAMGVVLAAVATVGGLQTAKAWRRHRRPAFVPVAGLSAGLLPLAAIGGGRAVGAVLLLAAAGSLAAGYLKGGRLGPVAASGYTVRAWLPLGLAAASAVLIRDHDVGAAVALVVLMCAYDSGDYILGAGARTPIEGPLGGILAVGVFTFALFVINLGPFHGSSVVVYGAVFAVLAPLGQLMASAVLPEGRAIASGLRRLDSLLLAGPVWATLIALDIGLS